MYVYEITQIWIWYDAEVMILNDVTSDPDSSPVQDIQNALDRLEDDYTIIVIGHRLSIVQNADRISSIQRGKITGAGTPEDLVRSDRTHAELYEIQT